MRDLSRQSDPQLAPADGSDCKYLFYTVFYQIFNRKMGKNVQASGNTDRNMGEGPERMSEGHLESNFGPGHLNSDQNYGPKSRSSGRTI